MLKWLWLRRFIIPSCLWTNAIRHALTHHLINEANEELGSILLFSGALLPSTVLASEMYQSSLHPFKYSQLIYCPSSHTQGLFVCGSLCALKRKNSSPSASLQSCSVIRPSGAILSGRLMEYSIKFSFVWGFFVCFFCIVPLTIKLYLGALQRWKPRAWTPRLAPWQGKTPF